MKHQPKQYAWLPGCIAFFGVTFLICCGIVSVGFRGGRDSTGPATAGSFSGSQPASSVPRLTPEATNSPTSHVPTTAPAPLPTPLPFRSPDKSSESRPPTAMRVNEPDPIGEPESVSNVEIAVPRIPTVADREPLPYREWVDAKGKFRTSARFVSFKNGLVSLEKEDGKKVDLAPEKLSTSDREHLGTILRNDPDANVLIGRITDVMDGDTLTVTDLSSETHTIELAGIDAPETAQKQGKTSQKDLLEKAKDRVVWVEWKSSSKVGDRLGHIYIDGRSLNLELVAAGSAWCVKEQDVDGRLANAELLARYLKVGVWKDSKPVPPWEYRRGKR